MKPISAALRDLMAQKGLTPGDLWVAADLSGPSGLYRYLKGNRGLVVNSQAAETIERLAAALGVEPDYFLEYRMWQIRQAAKLYPELTNEVYEVLMAFVAREPGGLNNLKSKG